MRYVILSFIGNKLQAERVNLQLEKWQKESERKQPPVQRSKCQIRLTRAVGGGGSVDADDEDEEQPVSSASSNTSSLARNRLKHCYY